MIETMTVQALTTAYREGQTTPAEVLGAIGERAEAYAERNIWIHRLSEAEQRPYLRALAKRSPGDCPLWGIPFAIKDNIDLAGIPTTAACPAFSYVPAESARVVQRLIAAGAIPVGKTNLDQFATGLNGTRSPYGATANAFDPAYISGGSSAGSAVSVALGMASFSLGTDTAGSGRVPAAFNNLVGLKPTRGLLSATGLVPACRSLDCISVFALCADDAHAVLSCAEAYDPADAYSRVNRFANGPRQYGRRAGPLRLGLVPASQLQFFDDPGYARAYRASLARLGEAGVEFVEIDYAPFDQAARLLYEGPWVAERYLACQPLIDVDPAAIHPVVRSIVEAGAAPRATDLFRAQYRLEGLRQACRRQLDALDGLLTPTAGRLFRIDEMLAEPVLRNSQLGYYTNFMNLLDMAAVALPTAFTEAGLPFGLTLAGPAFSDRALLSIARRLQDTLALPLGCDPAQAAPATGEPPPAVGDPNRIEVLVCGAHMQGLPLNWQLSERGAVFRRRTRTAPVYRMYALPGGPPARPGLVLDETAGAAIEVEIWSMPAREFGSFVAAIPAPLGIGKVRTEDGGAVSGFICEPWGLRGATEITRLGGWRRYLQATD